MTATTGALHRARELAGAVRDPELPVLTIADLGVLRGVAVDDGGRVVVTITPTYSGCPAMDAIRADVAEALVAGGFPDVEVRTVLAPAWTTDWISAKGRRALATAGIAPPGPARPQGRGPVPVSLSVACPGCGSPRTRLRSRFGPTSCTALWQCDACAEPFEHVKAI